MKKSYGLLISLSILSVFLSVSCSKDKDFDYFEEENKEVEVDIESASQFEKTLQELCPDNSDVSCLSDADYENFTDQQKLEADIYFGRLDGIISDMEARKSSEIEEKLDLAFLYVQKGSLESQEEIYANKALETIASIEGWQESARAQSISGYAHEALENYDQSEKAFKESIALDPENVDTMTALGHMYWLSGDPENAKTYYSQSYTQSPTISAGYGLGLIAMSDGEREKARQLWGETSKIQTDFYASARIKSDVYNQLGVLDIEDGIDNDDTLTIKQAMERFEQSLLIDPSYTLPRTNHAYAQFVYLIRSTQMTDEKYIYTALDALATIGEQEEADPDRAFHSYKMGEIYYILGDSENTSKYLRIALKKIPTDLTLNPDQKEDLSSAITQLQKDNIATETGGDETTL